MRIHAVVAAAVAILALGACASAPEKPDAAVLRALAPTGKLRVAVYAGSPTSMVKDASGQTRGVTWDLGQALAARLGVPFEPVVFPRTAEVIEGLKSGKGDFTVTNATPARQKDLDFTPALFAIEQGYLVPAGSKLARAEDVDKAGIRVGVTRGSTTEGMLARQTKNLMLVPASSLKEAAELLSGGRIDAYATNKAILAELSDTLPGSRILPGRFGVEHLAIGVPKGREAGLAYLRRFAEEARADGTVQRALKRAGVRGTTEPETK